MYKNYFLMQEEPFSPVPSPGLFYKSNRHEKTWKHLVDCLRKKEPLVLTAGEYGTGKTLLCLKLIHLMKNNNVSPVVYIPSSGYNFSMLLEKIARALNIVVDQANETECRQRIYEYFETEPPPQNKYIYIVIDDIHEFGVDFIAGLSRLITFNHYGYFPIKLFLFGHTSFLQDLENLNLISFRQRIKTIPLLSPLTVPEVTEYIYFRLISSGASGSPVFDESAIELITSASRGLPRLINRICDNSLLVAYRKKTNVIDRKMVELAMGESGSRQSEMMPLSMPLPVPDVGLRQETPEPVRKRQRQTFFKPQIEAEPLPIERNELFAEPHPHELERSRKKGNPMDLKKNGFLDVKNLMIACLLLIIVLMVLFLFRDVRLNDGSGESLGHRNSGIVTKSIAQIMPSEDVVVSKAIARQEVDQPVEYMFFIPLEREFQN